MNISFKFCLAFCLFLPVVCLSQVHKPIDVAQVTSEIEQNSLRDTSMYEKLRIQDSLFQLLRIHYEYLSYKAKYEYAVINPDKNERIISYRRIKNFPYYIIHVPFYGIELSELYRKATRNLIYEYRGNLEALKHLEIVPSMRNTLYGILRIEIEHAGGTWDRGEIPIPPDMLDFIEKSKH
jgi:hypothetical protein